MTVDLDALIAEARERAHAYTGGPEADRLFRLADALESTLAELRQERERADEAASHAVLALAGRRNAVAALSRAKETIEKVRAEADAYGSQPDVMEPCGAVAQSLHFILTEYDKQNAVNHD